MRARLDYMATVDASYGRPQPQLFRHMPRSRIHAACAQAHRDAFGEQFGDGFSIARVNLPIGA